MMEPILSTYLYGAFDCLLLLCHVRVSELIFTQTIECRFTLKLVRNMMITYSQLISTDKYSQHSSIIWPVWLNAWVLVYELSGCGFKPRWCHLRQAQLEIFLNPEYQYAVGASTPLHFKINIPSFSCTFFLNHQVRINKMASKHCHLFTTLVL